MAGRGNILKNLECRKDYVVDFVRSYGDFLTHDEQLMMYAVLMASVEWAAKETHRPPLNSALKCAARDEEKGDLNDNLNLNGLRARGEEKTGKPTSAMDTEKEVVYV